MNHDFILSNVVLFTVSRWPSYALVMEYDWCFPKSWTRIFKKKKKERKKERKAEKAYIRILPCSKEKCFISSYTSPWCLRNLLAPFTQFFQWCDLWTLGHFHNAVNKRKQREHEEYFILCTSSETCLSHKLSWSHQLVSKKHAFEVFLMVKRKSFSCVPLFATPWTIFSRSEYWSA